MKAKAKNILLWPGRMAQFALARAIDNKVAPAALSLLIVGAPAVVLLGEFLNWVA